MYIHFRKNGKFREPCPKLKTPKHPKTELRTEGENRHVKQKKKHPNIVLCYSRGKEADPPKDDSVKDQKHGRLS